jgi:hypothetical protein
MYAQARRGADHRDGGGDSGGQCRSDHLPAPVPRLRALGYSLLIAP